MNVSKDHLKIHKIAYEQGLKGLDSQNKALSALRQRATAVISISGLAATFLGREALKELTSDTKSFTIHYFVGLNGWLYPAL